MAEDDLIIFIEHAAPFQRFANPFANFRQQLLHFPADRGLVHPQGSSDLRQPLAIKEVRREQKAFLRGKARENFASRIFESEVCRRSCFNRGRRKLPPVLLLLLFNADQTLARTNLIDVALREHHAQPSRERASPRIESQL